MAILSKNNILTAADLKRETVPCPEWGGDVIVQEISALDRDRLWKTLIDVDGNQDPINTASKVLVRCLVDEEGSRLFCDEEAETLGKRSTTVINRLFAVAQRLNKIVAEEYDIKNSAPGLNDSLPSDSV
jgi:hypothetical protein